MSTEQTPEGGGEVSTEQTPGEGGGEHGGGGVDWKIRHVSRLKLDVVGRVPVPVRFVVLKQTDKQTKPDKCVTFPPRA